MSALRPLLHAELLKLWTSRGTRALVGAMALVTLVLVALALSALDAGELAGARGVRRVLTLGGWVSCFFALALGIVAMTGEYRHATFGHAVLAAPRRWPVLAAKAAAYALAGLLLGLVALAATFAAGVPGLAAEDANVAYGSALIRAVIAGSLLAPALFAVIGVGLGALLRDQRLALGAGLGWTLLVDSLAMSVVPELGRLLPGGAVASLLRSQTQDVLPATMAGLVLLAYALALTFAGGVAMLRRDVT